MDACDFLEEMKEWVEIIKTPAIYKSGKDHLCENSPIFLGQFLA
jgi:hypothetical protein